MLGEVQRKKVHISFVEMEGRRYLEKIVEVTESDNPYSLQEKISSVVARDGAQNMYRITLTGERDPGFVPQVREYLKCGRILSVTDQTVPAFHLDVLRKKYEGKLIGRFIESFGEGGPTGVTEEKALYYGLEALLYPGGQPEKKPGRREKNSGD